MHPLNMQLIPRYKFLVFYKTVNYYGIVSVKKNTKKSDISFILTICRNDDIGCFSFIWSQ
jgi:hypothetical protein